MKLVLMALLALNLPLSALASPNFDRAKEVFLQDAKVQKALSGLELRANAQAILLATDPDACNVLNTYLVSQPAAESDSSGWETISGLVNARENTCGEAPDFTLLSVQLVRILEK